MADFWLCDWFCDSFKSKERQGTFEHLKSVNPSFEKGNYYYVTMVEAEAEQCGKF